MQDVYLTRDYFMHQHPQTRVMVVRLYSIRFSSLNRKSTSVRNRHHCAQHWQQHDCKALQILPVVRHRQVCIVRVGHCCTTLYGAPGQSADRV